MGRRTEIGRRRAAAVAVSVAFHLAIPFVLIVGQREAPPRIEDPPIVVSLARLPPPPPPPPEPKAAEAPGGAPATTPEPAPEPKPPPKARARPTPIPPPDVEPLRVAVAPAPAPQPMPSLSEGQLAGARTAGSGSGAGTGAGAGDGPGGGCDMVQRLQAALRRDPEVRAAIGQAHRQAGAGGRAVLVWAGDWIRSPDQEGKGLAGVRQAIVMEVAFAPEACRDEPMRGLVLLSMADGPGAPRVVLGQAAWRWTDLLGPRRRVGG